MSKDFFDDTSTDDFFTTPSDSKGGVVSSEDNNDSMEDFFTVPDEEDESDISSFFDDADDYEDEEDEIAISGSDDNMEQPKEFFIKHRDKDDTFGSDDFFSESDIDSNVVSGEQSKSGSRSNRDIDDILDEIDDESSYSDIQQSAESNINENKIFEKLQSKNLGFKSIAFIVATVFAIICFILIIFSKASIVSKKQDSNKVSSTQVETQQGSTETGGGSEKLDVSKASSSGGLKELPSDTVINYTGDVYTSTGKVHDKVKFLQNSQVIYCVKINVDIADKTKIVNYYCGYNVFDEVDVGDTVNVEYQVVSDTCYSVNTITK